MGCVVVFAVMERRCWSREGVRVEGVCEWVGILRLNACMRTYIISAVTFYFALLCFSISSSLFYQTCLYMFTVFCVFLFFVFFTVQLFSIVLRL